MDSLVGRRIVGRQQTRKIVARPGDSNAYHCDGLAVWLVSCGRQQKVRDAGVVSHNRIIVAD